MKVFAYLVLPVLIVLCTAVFLTSFFMQSNPIKIVHPTPNSSYISPSPVIPEQVSGSDASYIEIIGGETSKFKLVNANDEVVGEGYLQQPDGVSSNNRRSMMWYTYPKPTTGEYRLYAEGLKGEGVQILLYDKNGNVNSKDYLKNSVQQTAGFKIYLDKDNSNLSSSQLLP